MKRISFILTSVIILVLSSCSNDDIPVRVATTFKINPANVIQPFSYEINPGDLEGVDSDNALRIRLLVYNSDDVLVQEETQYLSNYASIVSTSVNLEDGYYTAVAITDIVEKSGEVISWACWELSDEKMLTTAKITDLGYIGGQAKILGIGSKKFSVTGIRSQEISINPTPAGAVVCVLWRHIHAYDNFIERIALMQNRSSDYLVLNKDGGYNVAIKNNNNEFNWYTGYTDPADYSVENVYGYYFMFPMNNVGFRFSLDTAVGESINTDSYTFDIKAGSEYYFVIDLEDSDGDISYGGYEITSARSITEKDSAKMADEKESIPVQNNSMKLRSLVQ